MPGLLRYAGHPLPRATFLHINSLSLSNKNGEFRITVNIHV